MKFLGDRVQHGGAKFAADAESVSGLNEFRRIPQRARNLANGLTRFEREDRRAVPARRLKNQRDRSGLRTRVSDHERNPFEAFREMHNDELSGSTNLGKAWSPDIETDNIRTKLISCKNCVHEKRERKWFQHLPPEKMTENPVAGQHPIPGNFETFL